MNNESEFIFDDVLESGFTVVPNAILTDDRLTDTAIGLYCRIIRCKNIPSFKIYQSTLINEKNKKTKIANAIKELISTGWIEKQQLRNEKGHLCGVKYKVYSKAQPIENTNVKPKAEKPISDKQNSVKPTSDKQTLINKDNKKIKNKKNKDLSSSIKERKKDSIEEEELKEKIQKLKEETLGTFKYYDYKKLINAANGDLELILYIYENTLNIVSDEKPIRNLVAYMLKSIKNELS